MEATAVGYSPSLWGSRMRHECCQYLAVCLFVCQPVHKLGPPPGRAGPLTDNACIPGSSGRQGISHGLHGAAIDKRYSDEHNMLTPGGQRAQGGAADHDQPWKFPVCPKIHQISQNPQNAPFPFMALVVSGMWLRPSPQ